MGASARIWKSSLVGLVTLSLLGAALWLVRKGQVQRAAAFMLGTPTLSLRHLMFLNQGVNSPGVTAFRAILLLASRFATRRVLLTILFFMYAVLTGIVVAILQGRLVNVVPR